MSVRDAIRNLEDQSHQRYSRLYLTQVLTSKDAGDKGPLSIYDIAIDAPGSALEDPPEIRWEGRLGLKSGDSRVAV